MFELKYIIACCILFEIYSWEKYIIKTLIRSIKHYFLINFRLRGLRKLEVGQLSGNLATGGIGISQNPLRNRFLFPDFCFQILEGTEL